MSAVARTLWRDKRLRSGGSGRLYRFSNDFPSRRSSEGRDGNQAGCLAGLEPLYVVCYFLGRFGDVSGRYTISGLENLAAAR